MPKKLTLVPLKEKIKELERVYLAVQKELGAELMGIDIGNYRELDAMKAQKRTNVLIAGLNRYAVRWANQAVSQAYRKSYMIARTRLEILGVAPDRAFNTEKHRQTVMSYANVMINDLLRGNMSIKTSVDTYLYLVRRASQGLMQIQEFNVEDEAIIGEIIMDTIEEHRGHAYASKRMHDYFRVQLLDGQFISRKGRHYTLKYYSDLVARTKLREAQTKATLNTCEQYQNDLVQWSRHANPCPECAEHEGQVYSRSGTHPTYSLLTAEPPLHPQCEHDITPTSEVAIRAREAYA